MKSKRGTYISELNENINYGERTLKGVPAVDLSTFWRSDSTPCQAILRLFFIAEFWLTLSPMGGVNILLVNHNVNEVLLELVVTFAGIEEPVTRKDFASDSSEQSVKTLVFMN